MKPAHYRYYVYYSYYVSTVLTVYGMYRGLITPLLGIILLLIIWRKRFEIK